MDKQKDKILVTGATGSQGGALANRLLSAGYAIRALTRKPEGAAARALAAKGAEIVQGDLDDAASVEKALAGVWGAYGVQNTWEAGVEKEEEQGKRFALLAKKAGVQHFVYSSVGSAHRNTGIPHFDNKWRVEETIRQAGFPSYTVFRPVFFMENFLGPWFKPAIDQGKLTIGIRPDTKLQMIAVDDIGKFLFQGFDRHQELNGRGIELAGDSLVMSQVTKVMSQVTAHDVVFEPTPIEETRKYNGDYASMLEWFDRVGYEADIPALEREFKFKPATFPEWAARTKW